ncbi:c-type cytochrome [Derxia lacustris]|uniref:c-type cytochrome n=1 Tax=Derxia lacustris TaxID=764842 RepID=UPI000A16D74F|nr:c-type cytochrome [Derxia lacustris]
MNQPMNRIAALLAASVMTVAAQAEERWAATPQAIAIPPAVAAPAPSYAAPPADAAAQSAQRAKLSQAGEGRRAYLKLNCYSCHGMGATGGMGPNIVHAERGDVAEALLKGEDGGMRSYRGYVTATDITNIALYLRSIGTVNEPKFNDWWVAVPTK